MFKRVVITTLVAGILCLSGVASDLQDFTKGKEKITRNGIDFYIEPNSPMKQEILGGKYDDVAKSIVETNDTRQTRAVNPPLSEVYIYEVESTQGGIERLNYRQGTTTKDHGGSKFLVRVRVTGFGCFSDVAQFNKQAVKQSTSSFLVSGNTAYGCIDVRDLSGKGSSGSFVFTSYNSSGFPGTFKQISESLLIK